MVLYIKEAEIHFFEFFLFPCNTKHGLVVSLVKIIGIMGELNSHQIARIILKMRYETATEEEKRVLEAWMKAGKGRQTIYDRIVSDESLKEYRDLKAEFEGVTDYGKLQSDILGTLAKRDRQRKLQRISWWGGSVAAVLLVACLFVYKYVGESHPERMGEMRVAKIESEPIVQDKVILVLGDGKRVGMQGLHKDSLRLKSAVVVGAEAKLVYDANTGQGAEDVSLEPEINKVITSTGGFYSLILSDGTRIWLNSESELEYPVFFGKGERRVKLVGEAFFEVTPDVARPFIVEANEIRTRVLGTSFNIKAYKDESDIYATLFTGKVAVEPLADTTRKVILQPGKQAGWDVQARKLSVREVNLDRVMAWKEGMFMFNKENIEVVTRQIERWYGVKFIYQVKDRNQYTFNGYFSKDETLESILDAFTYTGGPKFRKEGDTVYVTDPL